MSKKIDLDFMERYTNNLNNAITDFVNNKILGKQNKPIIKSAILDSGSTSVTFTDLPTTGNYLYSVYTSVPNVDYTSMDGSTAGSITVTYEAQSSGIVVYLRGEQI